MLVTLLTDFGVADTYVGQLKAALLAVAPRARLVDLTHAVPAQDIRAGAFQLWTAVAALAQPCLHLAVVDPGVGTRRRAIAARSRGGHVFVGPDNGLLPPAIERTGGLSRAVALEDARYFGPIRSRTFHGRDVFAPVAGHLLRGLPLGRLGPRISDLATPFRLPSGSDAGEVIHVDRFGNLITTLAAAAVPARFEVLLGRRRVRGSREAVYASVKPGALVALVGSSGLVEIACRNGSAAAALRARVGLRVKLVPATRAG